MSDGKAKNQTKSTQLDFDELLELGDEESLEDLTDKKKFLREEGVPEFKPPYREDTTLRNLVGIKKGFLERLLRPIISKMVESTKRDVDRRPLSFIFQGKPGTGKSVMSRVLANTLSTELKTLRLERIQSKYVGVGENNFRGFIDGALMAAKSHYPKPLIIRCEEAEILLRGKKEFFGEDSDNDGYGELLPLLLSALSGDYLSDDHSRSFVLWIFNINEKDVVGKALKSRSIPFEFSLPNAEVSRKLFIHGTVGKGYDVEDYRKIEWDRLGATASRESLSHREIIRACEIAKAKAVMRRLNGSDKDKNLLEMVSNPDLLMENGEQYTIKEEDLDSGLQESIKQRVLKEE